MHTQLALVGDIGGTNARLALMEAGELKVDSIRQFAVAEFSSFESLVEGYLSEQVASINQACLGVAGPVIGNLVDITNNRWQLNRAEFCHHFDLEECDVLNDFAILAYAIPTLKANELLPIGPELEVDHHFPKLVLGPGTGLGMSILVKTSTGWQALESEGGNVNFCPANERDIHFWRFLRNRCHGTGYERILSGPGLELLYEAHASMAGEKALLSAPEITRKALSEPGSISFEVVEHFCELLGHCAGNAALTVGARGGVYISGGIMPKMKEILQQGTFRKAFKQRDKVPEYMDAIPTWLILAEYPGLTGAAAFLNLKRANIQSS